MGGPLPSARRSTRRIPHLMDEKGRRMQTSTHKRRPVLKLSLDQKEKWSGVLLVLPAVLAILAVVVYPLVSGILNSLRDAHMMRLQSASWNGFDNYIKLFRYPYFGLIVRNTVVYAASVTLGAGAIGLLLALSLSRQTRVNRMLRGLFFIPWIMPGVVVGTIFWQFSMGLMALSVRSCWRSVSSTNLSISLQCRGLRCPW